MRFPLSFRASLIFAAFLIAGSLSPRKAQAQFALSGAVVLEGVAHSQGQTVAFVFTSTDATPAIFTRSVTLGENGAFSLSNLPANTANNTYTVWIKGYKWLAKTVPAISQTHSTLNVTLSAGDANNENSVDANAFALFIGAYDSSASVPGSGYDDRADFDCDGSVNATDFALIVGNYSQIGDAPPFLPGANGPNLVNSVLWDLPAPDYGAGTVPMDGSGAGGAVNLTSGVYENDPGVDLDAFNPVGPDPAYVRTYHSGRASQGYGSPGLASGWIDNYDYTIFAPPLGNGGYGAAALIYPNGAMDVMTPKLDSATRQPVASNSAYTLNTGGAYGFSTPAQVPYFVTGSLTTQAGGANTPAGCWDNLYITFADNRQMVFSPVGGGLYRFTALRDLKHDVGAIGRTLNILRDGDGKIQSIANDDNRTGAAGQTLLQFTYSGANLSKITDVNGGRCVQYEWNGGNLRGVRQMAPVTQPAGGANFLWQYDYATVNTWSLLSAITVPSPTPSQLALPQVVITYDAGGRVQKIADEETNVRVYEYDGDGVTRVTVPTDTAALTAASQVQTRQQYYSRNRDAGSNQTYTQPNGADTTTIASAVGYLESNPYLVSYVIDQNGNKTDLTYDGAGNPLTVKTPVNGNTVTEAFTYRADVNPLGWLTRIDSTPKSVYKN